MSTTNTPYTTTAICLKTNNYSDTSKIGTWLSPTHGVIRAIAKGVRGKHRQLAGACLPLAVNELQFKPGRNLHTVSQSRIKLGFEHTQQHLLASSLAFTLYACTHALAGHEDGDTVADLYPPLVEALQAMENEAAHGTEDAATYISITLHGLQELCMASGHAPEWHQLVDLDTPLPDGLDPIKFSCALGGVVSPSYHFNHEPPIQLTRQTWQCLSQPHRTAIANHPTPDKLLGFYQHFVANVTEKRHPLSAFDFACQLLAQPEPVTAP